MRVWVGPISRLATDPGVFHYDTQEWSTDKDITHDHVVESIYLQYAHFNYLETNKLMFQPSNKMYLALLFNETPFVHAEHVKSFDLPKLIELF